MKKIYLLIPVFLLLLSGCGNGDERTPEDQALIDAEGIHIEGAWARPGSEGRMSAAYFLITNFDELPDTLLSANSSIAQLTEIHESYEREDDMIGMREVGSVEIPAESTVRFEQGGLHIMLIQLTEALTDGDSFELTLEFAGHGEIVIDVPVRL